MNNYKIKWRIVPLPSKKENASYWFFFARKWADFMRNLLSLKVSKSVYAEMPKLRRVIPRETRSEDWIDHLKSRNEAMAEKFMAVSTVFDDKPVLFKAYVLATVFNFTATDFEEMMGSLQSPGSDDVRHISSLSDI